MSGNRFLLALPPVARLLFLLLIFLGSGSVFYFLATLIVYATTGANMISLGMEALDALPEGQRAWSMKALLIMQSIGMFVVPPLVYMRYLTDRQWTLLRMDRLPRKWFWLGAAGCILLVQPLVNVLAELNMAMDLSGIAPGLQEGLADMEEQATANQDLFLSASSFWGWTANVIMVALIPAVGEEMLFRGVLQSICTRITRNAHVGIWLTAFLFSAWHFQFFTFFPRFFLGALLGYLLHWSGSLWLPILAHFANNSLAVIGYYLMNREIISEETAHTGAEGQDWLWTLAFSCGLFLVLRRMWLQRSFYPTFPEERWKVAAEEPSE